MSSYYYIKRSLFSETDNTVFLRNDHKKEQNKWTIYDLEYWLYPNCANNLIDKSPNINPHLGVNYLINNKVKTSDILSSHFTLTRGIIIDKKVLNFLRSFNHSDFCQFDLNIKDKNGKVFGDFCHVHFYEDHSNKVQSPIEIKYVDILGDTLETINHPSILDFVNYNKVTIRNIQPTKTVFIKGKERDIFFLYRFEPLWPIINEKLYREFKLQGFFGFEFVEVPFEIAFSS